MRLRFAITASLGLALGLAFVTPSGAMPFTAHFGAVETEVNEREAALPAQGRSKDQKKQASAHKTVLKKLGKTSTKLSKDVATGATVDKKLAKVYPADEEMDGLLDALLGNLLGEIDAGLDTLDAGIAALAAAKPDVKAGKDAAKARDLLGQAETALTNKDKYKFAKKAAAKLASGAKNLAKAEKKAGGGGGGGGANACTDGRAPTGGEFGTITVDGVQSTADELQVFVDRDGETITRWAVEVETCFGNDQYALLGVSVNGEPVVGFYSFGDIMGTGGSLFYKNVKDPDAFGRLLTGATIEVTSYDAENGIVEGHVTNDDPLIDILFRTESGLK